MSVRVTERLTQARRRQFVGRQDEQEFFRSTLAAPDFSFQLLYLFGPGGVGKTTLLREFASIAEQAQVTATYLDARNIEPAPQAFLAALQGALGVSTFSLPETFSELPDRCVLLIDTFENIEPIHAWLRESFIPELPAGVLVVLAGRNAPAREWRTDPGWQSIIRVLTLRNLTPEESKSYLDKRHLPPEQHQAVLDFTHGHPLALSLVADAFAQRPGHLFQPESEPDIIKTLVEQFVQKVPSPAHRAALEACALIRVTTEGLLGQMLHRAETDKPLANRGADLDGFGGVDLSQGSHELFEWLRSLSFIESSPEGIFPHDLARETLTADLRWRNPDWNKELHQRARTYYVSRVQQTHGVDQQRTLLDFVFLHRHNPVIRSMLEWQTGGGVAPDSMRPADRAELIEMVTRHEGIESAQIATHWLEHQPEGIAVFRSADGMPQGLLFIVELNRASRAEIQADPATRVAWEYLERHAPLRQGEVAAHYRFWMARETYQEVSTVQTAILLSMVRYQLTAPALAYHFLPCAKPEVWEGAFTYANLKRLPGVDYTVGGKAYGVYVHDWRLEPSLSWLALLAEREVSAQPQTITLPVTVPLVMLSEPDFQMAVRAALHDYARTDVLLRSPLLQSRLVAQRAGAATSLAQRVPILQDLLKEAIESLAQSPRDSKLYRAVLHTYQSPAPTQEMAAEMLNLPFSTYRRHLKSGLDRVVESLWHREIGH